MHVMHKTWCKDRKIYLYLHFYKIKVDISTIKRKTSDNYQKGNHRKFFAIYI